MTSEPGGGGHAPLHLPARPSWTCGTTGRPWPDQSCQVWLAEMFRDAPHALRAEMESAYAQAIADRPDEQVELRDQILGWLERK